MSDYYWDNQIEYLRNTRWLYYNDDYLEFLVQRVWKLNKAVNIIDYGCGYGYLGIKMLPLLPAGSTYTGVDKGETLINKAKEVFQNLPYKSEFTIADMEDADFKCEYDIAICHAFLLHMTDPASVLQKMINSVVDNGKIICFEPHWIGGMSSCYLDELEQSKIVQLGVLQKLFEKDKTHNGKDGNIGMRIPVMLSQLGIKDVDCRVSDRVNLIDQNMDTLDKEKLFNSLREEGLGQKPGEISEVINNLIERGLSSEEAERQYRAELLFSKEFGDLSWLTYAPSMKISFGIVKR